MIDINDFMSVFHGAKEGGKFCETELNEILFNSIPNSCSRQAYV